MGRLKKTRLQESDTTQFCTRDDVSTRCRMSRKNATWFEQVIPFEPPFVAKKRAAKRERKCSACDRHDSASFVDRRTRETPLTNAVPQLSVGQPTTVSTERMLAAALRRHACPDGPSAPCPALYAVFGEDSWKRGQLLNAMLKLAVDYQRKADTPANDAALWASPWVKCERVQNISACRGSISKAEWKDPKTRIGACLREMRGPLANGPSSMDFCSLSEETAELCRKVVEWNNAITHALCSAGNHAKCTARAFYYNPSQYSASNKDFVYNSVASLYAKLNASACPVEAQSQSESNQVNLGQCMSTILEPSVFVVRLVRLVLRKLVMMLYYVYQVLFAMGGVVVTTLAQAPAMTTAYFADNLSKFVHLLLTVSAQALEQIWQIAWTFADFGELAFIRGIVQFMCYLMQYVVYPFLQYGVVPAMQVIKVFMQVLDEALCAVSLRTVCGTVPVGALDQVLVSLRDSKPRECESSFSRTPGQLRDTLPVATRCWATYNTYYGDSTRLSCTAADTCRRGPTDFALQMCGACAAVEDNLPFGCYDVTKTCTCNLPRLTEQGCSSNEECASLDATCRFVDRELQPSIGFTKCAACQTKRICLVKPGRSDGFCACGLVDIELQRCVAQAKPVMPAYDKLCLYTRDYAFLTTTSYVFSFYTSMTAPCNDLNPASTYCARESSDGQLYAVGVDSVRRRRLLSDSSFSVVTADDTHNSLCKDALSGDAMPAYRETCRVAYRYSRETLAQLELDGRLPACTFCSVEDMVQGLLYEPNNLVMIASNVSRISLVVMRHSPMRVLVESMTRIRRHLRAATDIAAVEPALDVQHVNHSWHVRVLVDHPSVEMVAQVLRLVLWFAPRAPELEISDDTRHSRRLLTIDDVAEAVQQNFRVSAALRQAFATQLASSLDFVFEAPVSQKEWMRTWPPKIGQAALEDGVCPPLTNMLRTTRRAMLSVGKAYSMQDQSVPVVSVRDAWVNVSRRSEVNVSWADFNAVPGSNDPVVALTLFSADRLLAFVNISPNSIFDVIASGADQFWNFVQCDYEAMQTCSKWHRHIVPAAIVVGIYYFIAYTLGAAAGLSMPIIFAAVVLPSIVMFMSYGYAPLCFPTVPVCLFDDLVYSVKMLVPRSIELPSVMYRSEICMKAAAKGLTAECLRTCTDEPFAFIEWYDVLAWWSLELGVEARLAQLAQQPFVVLILGQDRIDDVLQALVYHARVLNAQDEALTTTKRVCALLSVYKLVPHAVILFFALMLVFGSLQVLQQTVTVVFQTIFALLVSAFY
jgi:predicted secreted protein